MSLNNIVLTPIMMRNLYKNNLVINKPKSKNEEMFGSWYEPLKMFVDSDEFKQIGKTLKQESESGKTIRPLFSDMFRPFKSCSWDKIKVVILTNNPYIGDESDGLALSSGNPGQETPKVLQKVFDTLEKEVAGGLYLDPNNDLERWANQGVLLLNCDISTIKGKRGVHLELWKPFIQHILETLNLKAGVIFCLIGSEALKYARFINESQHAIFRIEHPMKAVIENRDWETKEMFKTVSKLTEFIFDQPINWTENETNIS